MSLFGKVGKLVTQSASHRINTEAIRPFSYLPNSKSFIGGIPSQSDEQALNPRALPGRRVRVDDALYRHVFEGLSGVRRYSAARVSSTVALANVAGAGALNLAVFWHINDGIREILADYVHHEMTRTVMLVNLRLFLIIAAKDVFVSFAF